MLVILTAAGAGAFSAGYSLGTSFSAVLHDMRPITIAAMKVFVILK